MSNLFFLLLNGILLYLAITQMIHENIFVQIFAVVSLSLIMLMNILYTIVWMFDGISKRRPIDKRLDRSMINL